jgi:hypothetical protein
VCAINPLIAHSQATYGKPMNNFELSRCNSNKPFISLYVLVSNVTQKSR